MENLLNIKRKIEKYNVMKIIDLSDSEEGI